MQRQGAHLTMVVKRFIPLCSIDPSALLFYDKCQIQLSLVCFFFLGNWKHFTFLKITKKESLFYRELSFTENNYPKYTVRLSVISGNKASIGIDRIRVNKT